MTTPLVKPLSRELLVAGTAYRLTLTADRVKLTGKGKRVPAADMTWDEVLAWRVPHAEAASPSAPKADVPHAVLGEIAGALREATALLGRAGETLAQAGALPAELRMQTASDPHFGRPEHRDDWFIEPLLTEREVASILRLSTRAVRRLALRSIRLGGQTRYRQSELRHFLQNQESKLQRW